MRGIIFETWGGKQTITFLSENSYGLGGEKAPELYENDGNCNRSELPPPQNANFRSWRAPSSHERKQWSFAEAAFGPDHRAGSQRTAQWTARAKLSIHRGAGISRTVNTPSISANSSSTTKWACWNFQSATAATAGDRCCAQIWTSTS